jgi:RNAse (barnase) inhibitor barstar
MSASFTAKRSGIYRAPGSVGVLRAQAEKAGCLWIELPLAVVDGKKAYFDACRKALKLPSYFGGNWDALADCARDLNWLEAKGYVLHLAGAAQFAKAAGDDYDTALSVFEQAAEFWQGRDKPFVVLVDGAAKLKPF